MTTTFENSKGYKVLTLSAAEIKVWVRAKVCDRCGRKISSSGFYVGAVNLMYCPDCYEEWHECRNIPTSGNDYERSEEIGNRRIGTFIRFQY